MRNLNHDFKQQCQRNRDGSFQTQHDRDSIELDGQPDIGSSRRAGEEIRARGQVAASSQKSPQSGSSILQPIATPSMGDQAAGPRSSSAINAAAAMLFIGFIVWLVILPALVVLAQFTDLRPLQAALSWAVVDLFPFLFACSVDHTTVPPTPTCSSHPVLYTSVQWVGFVVLNIWIGKKYPRIHPFVSALAIAIWFGCISAVAMSAFNLSWVSLRT